MWGQHSSYSHLSEYYARKNPDSALYYAKITYELSKKIESPDNQLEALKQLVNMSSIFDSKKYFNSYQLLLDSILTSRNSSKNQFALIRYETEKHKANNLVLQKKNTEKNYQISMLIAGTGLLSLGSWFWYRKRRQRLALEAENAIRESQLKTSKKVHDVVANGLYRVMSEMENQEQVDREAMLDRIETLYEKSRDISYEDPMQNDQSFQEKMGDLIKSFATENIHIAIVGNSAELWTYLSLPVFYEVEHVLQELMVNMKKHSQASNVTVRFEQQAKQIHIFYTDNGIGFAAGTKFNNGLRNTGNRISNIGGLINFDAEVERGVKIQISFPIH